jgi:GT2 family glycosyltransferase
MSPEQSQTANTHVAVIVLNWNGWQDTLGCLEALDRLAIDRTAHTVELIVVDNGSTDGSFQHISEARPGITMLQSGSNLGYAGGNNIGIREALRGNADYVWILNNDTRPHPDTLGSLLAAAGDKIGILASRFEPAFESAFRGGQVVTCVGCEVGFHEADRVVGASLFFRADVFRKVGLFDERYFHYAEDDDLAIRTSRGGWGLGLVCGSVVDHVGGASLARWSPQASYYMIRNRALLDQRYFGDSLPTWLLRNRRRIWAHLAPRRSLRNLDPRRGVAVVLALTDVVRTRTGRRDLGSRYQQD